MDQQTANQVAEIVRIVLQRNIDNKITPDLATGMYSNISNSIATLVTNESDTE